MNPFCNPRRVIQTPRASQGWGLPGGAASFAATAPFFSFCLSPESFPKEGRQSPPHIPSSRSLVAQIVLGHSEGGS